MLFSIAIILLLGIIFGGIFNKLKLPSLLGMIIVGIIISPHSLNLIDKSIINISSDIRQIALVIILTRAGLSLDLKDLKKVGRPAFLMCFVPAIFEIIGAIILAPIIFGVSILEAAIIGSVIAAVSPAVIVPRMIKMMEEGYGTKKSIPQLILAGASVDDIFVIVVFTALLSLAKTGEISMYSIAQVPTSIFLGVLLGVISGYLLIKIFKIFHIRDSIKILIILSVSFLLIELQKAVEKEVSISALLAIMSIGIMIKQRYTTLAVRLSIKYNKLWVGAEIFLFVLVGMTVDLKYVAMTGLGAVLLVLSALIFRAIGVYISLAKTNMTKEERRFCVMAYIPKATVQAAIGSIPYSMGLACGEIVLTVAVLSILITAPLGAVGIDRLYKRI